MRGSEVFGALTIAMVLVASLVSLGWYMEVFVRGDPLPPTVAIRDDFPTEAPVFQQLDTIEAQLKLIIEHEASVVVVMPSATPTETPRPTSTPRLYCTEATRENMQCDPRTPTPVNTPTHTPSPEPPSTAIVPCLTVEAEVRSGLREDFPRECLSQWSPTPESGNEAN